MWLRFWGRNVTLSDYVELNPRVNLLRGANVPFVSMDIISPGTRKVYPVQERPASGSGSKFGPGDTLFARITPCLENGKIAQYAGDRAGMGSTEFFVLRARDDISDPAFVYYFSQNPDLRSAAEKSMSGASGRQRAVISSLSEFECEFPPLAIQKRIAGILSAYDELIENSQRRIKILEAMARGLYREWFVHFRFPGHENHPRVDSAMGEIPQGWELRKLKDVCNLVMGQSPKSEFYNDTGDGLPFHQGVTNFGGRFPTDKLYCTSDGRLAYAGDVLFSVRAPVGRMNFANKKIILGRGLSAIRHKQNHQAFLWEQLGNKFTEVDMIGNGAIFASVTKDDVQNIELVCPPSSLIEAATKHFEPIHLEVSTLSDQIQNLRRTRDLLLPRLLSGQINVETAEHV